MITPDGIRKQAERAYPRFLRSLVSGESFFPLEIRFGKKGPTGSFKDFAGKRQALLDGSGEYMVEVETRRSRRFGEQHLPTRLYFDDPARFAAYLRRSQEVDRLLEAVALTRSRRPDLLPWMAENAHRITGYLDRWEGLLSVCSYFLENPRPGLYARELPLPVDTKFVETNTGILRSMLDFLLPPEAVDGRTSDFAPRFGLRYDEPLVRLRALDRAVDWPALDLSLPVSSFASLDLAPCSVIICENKMTFLTLPQVENGVAIFGGGFKIELLREASWVRRCDVLYWGDLDAHGFMILSQLRSFHPGARSVMMDVETFETFRSFAADGKPCPATALPHLTPEEHAVFESLARSNLRLEQERIPHVYAKGRLGGALRL